MSTNPASSRTTFYSPRDEFSAKIPKDHSKEHLVLPSKLRTAIIVTSGSSDQHSVSLNSKATTIIQQKYHNPDLSSDDEPTSQENQHLEQSIGNQTSQQFVPNYSNPDTKFKNPVSIYPHSDAKKQSEESATQFKPNFSEVDFYQKGSSKPFETNSQTRSAYRDQANSDTQYNEFATTAKVDRSFRSSLSATHNTKKVPSQLHSSINRRYYHQAPTKKFDPEVLLENTKITCPDYHKSDEPKIIASQSLDAKESTSQEHSKPKRTYSTHQYRQAKRQQEEFTFQLKTRTSDIDLVCTAASREVHPEVLLGRLLSEIDQSEIHRLYKSKYFTDEMLWNKFKLLLSQKEKNQINIIFSIVSQEWLDNAFFQISADTIESRHTALLRK